MQRNYTDSKFYQGEESKEDSTVTIFAKAA
jgi:hypothetical protein